MLSRTIRLLSFSALACGLPIQPARAQQSSPVVPAVPAPQVTTVGRGDVDLKPDRARIEFSVETRAQTAASASAETSRRQRAVLDTLKKLGVADAQISTANLQVTPEVVYPGQGQAPKVAGYIARNSIRIDVLRLELVGALVDAAIAKGATEASGLQFYSSRNAEVRREALAKAVESARADAQSMARAAGYELGALIELSSGNAGSDGIVFAAAPMPRQRLALAMAEPTPVNPGEIKISETVTARWALRQP
jgi:uncharacterized protein